MKLELAQSGMLIHGIAAVVIMAWLVQLITKIRVRGSVVRLFPAGLGLRFLVVLLLLFGLLEPFYRSAEERAEVLALLDISESMEQRPASELLDKLAGFESSGIRFDVLPFAESIAPVPVALSSSRDLERIRGAWRGLGVAGTDLEKALTGLSRYQNTPVVLISDGRETKGDFRKLAARLLSQGVRVFPLLPAENSVQGMFRISNLHAPLVAPVQKSVDIRVTLQNTTSVKQRGKLEVKHGAKVVLSKQVELAAGESVLEIAQSDPSAEGIREIDAVLTPDGDRPEVSSARAYLSGEGREKILLLSGSSEDERLIVQALKDQAYQVRAYNADVQNVALPDLRDFSVVLLNNIALGQLAQGSDKAIQAYVKSGGGLLMLGGNRSFGLGGYRDTPVEEVLPVRLVPPQSQKKRLNIAVELVLDKSRSMGENSRMDFAKEAAREVIRSVKDEDYVGVIGFDSVPFEVVKLEVVGSQRDEAISRVGRLYPTGKTMLLPAMEEARRRLNSALAGRKHMIILTDGQIEDAGTYYLEMVKQMRIMGITVSTVMVGGASDLGFLRSLAEVGGGAYYETSDPRALPRIFISDVKVASGERTMKEQDEFMVRPGPDKIESTTIRQFPPLCGYVETQARSGARLELVLQTEQRNDPLLAAWHYGQGRAAAFTSDANGRWSSFWAGWPGYVRFWTELIDSLRPENSIEQETVKFDLRHYFEKGGLNLDLSIFSEEAARSAAGTLIFPDGSERGVAFSREASGHYRAFVDRLLPGKYEFRGSAAGRKLTPVAFNLSSELFGEKKGLGYDTAALHEIATLTSGRVNPSSQELSGEHSLKVSKVDLTRIFILLAMLILVLEITVRELRLFLRSARRNIK